MLEEYSKPLLKQVNVDIHRAESQIFSNITNPCMSVDIKADLLDGYLLFIFRFWYYVGFFFPLSPQKSTIDTTNQSTRMYVFSLWSVHVRLCV